jgi:hypothetical protein
MRELLKRDNERRPFEWAAHLTSTTGEAAGDMGGMKGCGAPGKGGGAAKPGPMGGPYGDMPGPCGPPLCGPCIMPGPGPITAPIPICIPMGGPPAIGGPPWGCMRDMPAGPAPMLGPYGPAGPEAPSDGLV